MQALGGFQILSSWETSPWQLHSYEDHHRSSLGNRNMLHCSMASEKAMENYKLKPLHSKEHDFLTPYAHYQALGSDIRVLPKILGHELSLPQARQNIPGKIRRGLDTGACGLQVHTGGLWGAEVSD